MDEAPIAFCICYGELQLESRRGVVVIVLGFDTKGLGFETLQKHPDYNVLRCFGKKSGSKASAWW